ncbi:MAG: HAMP domain-containing protein [Hyphomicrobiales bacterium]|nr:HAMP domain-containing protein [Hyphomicrobiales bacterium]
MALAGYLNKPRVLWRRLSRWIASLLPKGLYQRALLIVVLPVVLLQTTIAWIFMERHWQYVTGRLSASTVNEIGALIDLYEANPKLAYFKRLDRIANRRLLMDIELLSDKTLPPALPKPFFSIIDTALSRELSRQIGKPFWIDTVGTSNLIEIRIQLKDAVLRVLTHRNQAYASNSHIFLIWMFVISLVLLFIAILFLRNQIRPIVRLAKAAEEFGKGREIVFRPHGAQEVRQAGHAFIEMKRRVERAIEQRTMMLSGVSHDLRTILTRFRLSLAVLPEGPELEELNADVDEMQRMLEAYLNFAKGAGSEASTGIDLAELLQQIKSDAERHNHPCSVSVSGNPMVTVRPDAFKRLLVNLVANAQRFGSRIEVSAAHEGRFLVINVDDDGPGIPAQSREDVFRPFMRLDQARNQDHAGTGLGLAIARDIARIHGGDIQLHDSHLGGLRATVRVPL